MPGCVIAFEGIDGSGKHTQVALARKWLVGMGIKPEIMRYPDLKGGFGEKISSFLKGKTSLSPEQQFEVFSEDIAKDNERLARLVKQGKVVVLDRFIASTIAYQTSKGFPKQKAVSLARKMKVPEPDLSVLFSVKPEVAVERKIAQKKEQGIERDVFEKDVEFLKKVSRAYEELAREGLFSKEWKVVDAEKPEAEIAAEIKAFISSLLKQNNLLP